MTNMKKRTAVLLAILLMLTALVGCAQKPADPAGETPETPESTEQTDAQVEEPYTYQHVIIIGVDGAGAYFKEAEMPRLNEIMKDGAVTYEMLTSKPSISAQCWGAMLTGLIPEEHHFSNSVVTYSKNPIDSDVPTIFRIIREQRPDAVFGSFCNWDAINYGIIEEGLDVTMGTGADAEVAEQTAAFVRENKPTLVFVQFDQADGVGHTYGFGGTEQLEQIGREDENIGTIYDAYVDAGILDDTLFIVTADHGGDGTSHGGWTDGEKYVMFAAVGQTTVKRGTIEDMAVRDTAAIVLHALGLDSAIPENWTARVPSGLFEGYTAAERKPDAKNYEVGFRQKEAEPTPEIGSGKSPVDVLGADRVIAYIPFDGDIADTVGGHATEQSGKLYYPEGYFGSGMQFDDGYVTLEGFEPGTNSFSVGFWMNSDISGIPALIANKGWASKANPGYAIALRYDALVFNIGNKKDSFEAFTSLPPDCDAGWVYALVMIDRENAQVGFSFDFGEPRYIPFPEGYENIDLTTKKNTVIGRDGTGLCTDIPLGTYDEFLFIDGVLTADDIAALQNCYVH